MRKFKEERVKLINSLWPEAVNEVVNLQCDRLACRQLSLSHSFSLWQKFIENPPPDLARNLKKHLTGLPLTTVLGFIDSPLSGLRTKQEVVDVNLFHCALAGRDNTPSFEFRLPRKSTYWALPHWDVGLESDGPIHVISQPGYLVVNWEDGSSSRLLRGQKTVAHRCLKVINKASGRSILNGCEGLPERNGMKLDVQEGELEIVTKAWGLLRQVWPQAAQSAEQCYSSFVVMKTQENHVHSFSDGDFLRLWFGSARDPVQVADAFVHESAHARMSVLLDCDSLLLNGEGDSYYSPWRKDLRPLIGVLNGVHAFLLVAEFYQRLSRVDVVKQKIWLQIAETQREKVVQAMGILRDSAKPTVLGKLVIDALAQGVDRLKETTPCFA